MFCMAAVGVMGEDGGSWQREDRFKVGLLAGSPPPTEARCQRSPARRDHPSRRGSGIASPPTHLAPAGGPRLFWGRNEPLLHRCAGGRRPNRAREPLTGRGVGASEDSAGLSGVFRESLGRAVLTNTHPSTVRILRVASQWAESTRPGCVHRRVHGQAQVPLVAAWKPLPFAGVQFAGEPPPVLDLASRIR